MRFHVPLYARVVLGVALGAVTGIVFGDRIVLGATTDDLGTLGLLVITLLKTIYPLTSDGGEKKNG